MCPHGVCDKDSSVKDHYQLIQRPFIIWRFHLVDFEKTYEYLSWIKPLCPFCVCDKDSTVKDNKSKDHSYFEEFTMDYDKTHENSIKNNSFVSLLFWHCVKDSTVKDHCQQI